MTKPIDETGSLPAGDYCDVGVFTKERRQIFRRGWHYVGALDRLRHPGDYFTETVDGVGIIVCSPRAGAVAAFINVCLHRCHEVIRGDGNASQFRCPYHGWTYSLDGCLVHSPGWTSTTDSDLRLRAVRLGMWGPLIFVCPSEAPVAFDDWFAPVGNSIREAGLDPGVLRFEARDPWSFRANWKIGIENFLECYHCPVTHPDMARQIDVRMNAIRFAADRWTSTQVAQPRSRTDSIFAPFAPTREARYHYLWPTTTITINPGPPSLLINAWRPEGPTYTRGFEDSFFGADGDAGHKAATIAYSTRIGDEDAMLVESVQRGVQSLAAVETRLVDGEESLIKHFRRLVGEAMSEL